MVAFPAPRGGRRGGERLRLRNVPHRSRLSKEKPSSLRCRECGKGEGDLETQGNGFDGRHLGIFCSFPLTQGGTWPLFIPAFKKCVFWIGMDLDGIPDRSTPGLVSPL